MPTQLKFNKSIKIPTQDCVWRAPTESVLNHRNKGFYAPIKEWFAAILVIISLTEYFLLIISQDRC